MNLKSSNTLRLFASAIAFLFSSENLFAQQPRKTENLIIVTIDGFRWYDVLNGADNTILERDECNATDSVGRFTNWWSLSYVARKVAVLPFIWKTMGPQGRIYGNRFMLNDINCKNPYCISYPGYNEIFSGYVDSTINSNDYGMNPNETVLEFINKINVYQGRVASFDSWDAFPRIFNTERSKIYVNAGPNQTDTAIIAKTKKAIATYKLPGESGFEHARYDAITYALAKDYVKAKHPKVLHIGFNDADEYGHANKYDKYLEATHLNDSLIGDLWNYIQSDPFYKDKTTLFITVDHGRGQGIEWTKHDGKTEGSNQTWFAVMSPDIKPAGEMKSVDGFYQNQFAKTLAAMLGLDFTSDKPIGDEIIFDH